MINIAGQKAYVMNNITGNVIALYSTDDNNTVLGQYEHSPYGDIIMNYTLSGKLQPGFPNQFASFSKGESFVIRESSLKSPVSIVPWNPFNYAKHVLGQRIYMQ